MKQDNDRFDARQSSPTRRLLERHGEVVRLSAIAVIIFAVMAALRPSLFLSGSNFVSMAFQIPEFAILSLAMMLAMLTAGIDLSIIGIMNLSAILGGLYLSKFGGGPGTAGILITIAIVLATGLLCGLLNGLLISRVGIPPILATLGTSQVYLGLGIVATKGAAVYGFPPAFSLIGNGSLLGVPVPLLILLLAAGIVAFLLNRTRFGAEVYMLGTNPLAARFAGIDSTRLILGTYAFSGLLSATAGVVVMSRVNSIRADFGASYLLLTILVAVLGGVNPYGGFGKVIGVLLAVVSLQLLSSGFNMLRFSNFAREFIWGALLLLVMVLGSGPFNAAWQRFKRAGSPNPRPDVEREETT
jgi:simple sugar transport system permease protein